MNRPRLSFHGVELYFDDLDRARLFYEKFLGLKLEDQETGRFARFGPDDAFVCLEGKGSESYQSADKAVLFFEVSDLSAAIESIGRQHFVASDVNGDRRWAVLHDPEQHNVLLFERNSA
jgi:predicted enzyme related to lactoylglutathione lyase